MSWFWLSCLLVLFSACGGGGSDVEPDTTENIDLESLEKGVLVDFAGSEAASSTPYKDWKEIIRSSEFTQYVSNSDPDCAGISETANAPNDAAFVGIKGETPINFQKGHKIVATFCNKAAAPIELRVRISFDDGDAPMPQDNNLSWHTMYVEHPDRETDRSIPPFGKREVVFNIADQASLASAMERVTVGPKKSINFNFCASQSCHGSLVLTKIELTNQADLTAPNAPENCRAQMAVQSEEAGASVVELSCDAAIDPPSPTGAQTGVERYMIYRDDKLIGTVPRVYAKAQGEHISFRDRMVAPNTTYKYSITAIDSAVTGIHRISSHSAQRGNESAKANVSFTTADFTADGLINPYLDVEFLGAFRLPIHDAWGYAFECLAVDPNGNPNPQAGELPGALYACGHVNTMEIAAVAPQPKLSSDLNALPRARFLKNFSAPWPYLYKDKENRATWKPPGGGGVQTDLTYHPSVNGVPARLYYTVANDYTPLADNLHGSFALNLNPAETVGAWSLRELGASENLPAALHDGFCFAADQDWAAQNAQDKSFICGQSFRSGVGIMSHGLSLYASAPAQARSLPINGAAVQALQLLRYGETDDVNVEHWMQNWSPLDVCTGGAWLKKGNKSAVMFACIRPVGDTWYGGVNGVPTWADLYDLPRFQAEPGWRAGEIQATFYFYNPEDLARVARGEMEPWEPQAYAAIDFKDLLFGGSDMYYDRFGAMTFDAQNGYIYFIENNSDTTLNATTDRRSVIYAWQLEP